MRCIVRAQQRPRHSPCRLVQQRQLCNTPRLQTDGVFRALTEQRMQVPWIEAFRKQQSEMANKSHSEPRAPAKPDLTPKKMSDSYHSVILPLAQEPSLLDTYLNATGHIRLGTIFMDLDALSGVIAYKHTGEGVNTVTAAFDRITINRPLTDICDLELSGQVSYAAGGSSMEISLQVAKAPKDGQEVKQEDVMITCQCTMVATDPATKRPVKIAPVRTDTEEEKRIFARGERNSKMRKKLSQQSLLKTAPNDEESDLIHAMWQRQLRYHDPNDSLRKPDNVFFMDTTRLNTAAIMQPQYRNRHHFMIFGGFLLKQTFELAFCCAASFTHTRPKFVSLDPSTFQNPVPVGSVLYLTATVVYTDPPLVDHAADDAESNETPRQTRVQVRVDSKVRDVEHGEIKPTGQFNYTFLVDKDVKVMPRTYSEFMMYVDARRRASRVQQAIASGASEPGKGEGIME
ncbi:acyl-coenzyme A thioesterase 9 [Metarhizium acridum CQMa 102]|uniref:Acyl-coenzyme A thioesterase 9 n=1 Tax=Metarhizium acridum (strain CQMa 102) TaxID=655827 RepID=E9E5U3_METAQ|nr:acyl-coenzyme A thioesterase 9 [Metarhizium acridum CQMa 102]EFY88806.1 acyl-coenzyme A thioesterase 9 [Metarhizium acridum CQMa 102]